MKPASVKPTYERPSLVKHQAGLMNKLSGVQAMRPLDRIDGVPVKELVARFGSPLFVFSERTLVSRWRELRDAFALRLPRTQLAWSYKTNYLDAVCKVFHREGSWAEVVSEMELDKALRHVPGRQVIFNGPFKPEGALEKAFRAGVRVHLDHFDEIGRAEAVARRLGVRPQVAIRVNMAVPGTPPWSRFGFNLENGQAMDAVRRLRAGSQLELRGLHSTSAPSSRRWTPTGRRPGSWRSSPTASRASRARPSSGSISGAASPRATRSTPSTCRASR